MQTSMHCYGLLNSCVFTNAFIHDGVLICFCGVEGCGFVHTHRCMLQMIRMADGLFCHPVGDLSPEPDINPTETKPHPKPSEMT